MTEQVTKDMLAYWRILAIDEGINPEEAKLRQRIESVLRFSLNYWWRYYYARDIIKGRWKEAEPGLS